VAEGRGYVPDDPPYPLKQGPPGEQGFFFYEQEINDLGSDGLHVQKYYRYWNGTGWEGPAVRRRPTGPGWYALNERVSQYWTGSEWESETLEAPAEQASAIARVAHRKDPRAALLRVLVPLLGAGIFLVLMILLAFGLGGDDEGEAPPAEEPVAAATAEPEGSGGTPPAAGETPDDSGETGHVPDTAATGAVEESEGVCRPRDYVGELSAAVEGLPAGAPVDNQVVLSIGPDCKSTAVLFWSELSSNQPVTARNPSGQACTIAWGEAGPQSTGPGVEALTLTPDGQGGGTLSGWMVFSTAGVDGPCPDDPEIHLGNPVGGVFSGTISGDVLTGEGTFSSDLGGRTVAISVEAIESEV
jgi:hypothetical protein